MVGLLQHLGLAEDTCGACGLKFKGSGQGFVCEDCLNRLKPYHPMDYSKRLLYVHSYRVFGLYEGILREVIQCIKFYRSKALALRLGQIIRNHIWEYMEDVRPDLITFPSLNPRRFWSRGFNHMEYLLKGAEVPYVRVFKRLDLKPPLAMLKKEERKRAVLGHRLKEELLQYLEGKRVLVVDDLLTTGSTIERLAYLLLSVGAEEVHAYFVGRG
ncbi:MAG: phosphoribosyltransferase family protein [Aquificaceae bacterium]|nr:phosphoribosyltransferase family protein [Aquificaceae bacterium]MCX8164885.1 phosphoribosyltransferase family protein [Aquificaceae bacterium]